MSEFAAAGMAQPKYIFENGVMKMNPLFAGPGAQQPAAPALRPAVQPLAVVSNLADGQLFSGAEGQAFTMSASASAAMTEMQSPAYQVG
jgi:hypothetical protein